MTSYDRRRAAALLVETWICGNRTDVLREFEQVGTPLSLVLEFALALAVHDAEMAEAPAIFDELELAIRMAESREERRNG